MSEFVIDNHIIDAPIVDILHELRKESPYIDILHDIKPKGDSIQITCPCHSSGREKHPSCGIVATTDKKSFDKDITYGTWHCFQCHAKGTLVDLTKIVLNVNQLKAESWLVNNFSNTTIDDGYFLEEIKICKPKAPKYLDESILKQYNKYCDYMWARKLKKQVVDACEVGYDDVNKMITFPVRDEKGKLVMITKRSINNKTFLIDKDVEKPVYLLYNNLQWGAKELYICESQINALTAIGYGVNAVALFGTGTPKQYEILNRCGIRKFVLAFDGDEAGDLAITRFLKNIKKDVFVSILQVPRGKDINDLSEEEFYNLKVVDV